MRRDMRIWGDMGALRFWCVTIRGSVHNASGTHPPIQCTMCLCFIKAAFLNVQQSPHPHFNYTKPPLHHPPKSHDSSIHVRRLYKTPNHHHHPYLRVDTELTKQTTTKPQRHLSWQSTILPQRKKGDTANISGPQCIPEHVISSLWFLASLQRITTSLQGDGRNNNTMENENGHSGH